MSDKVTCFVAGGRSTGAGPFRLVDDWKNWKANRPPSRDP